MGTRPCVEQKSSLVDKFNRNEWIAISHYPTEIWQNKLTGIKTTIHLLLNISQKQKYEYRHLNPNYLLSVVNLLSSKNGICNYEESTSLLMLQYVEIKLKFIQDLSVPQAFYTIKCALKGYSILSCFYGPLYTNEQLILINQYGNVKVWINEDLTQNKPSATTLIHNQKVSVKLKINYRIKKSIFRIVELVQKKCNKPFPQQFKQKISTFEDYDEAIVFVEQFMTFQAIVQIDKIDLSKHIRRPQKISDKQNSALQSIIQPNQSFVMYQIARLTQKRSKECNQTNIRQLKKVQCLNPEKAYTPQNKVLKKNVKSNRQLKKNLPIKYNKNPKKEEDKKKILNSFEKFREIQFSSNINTQKSIENINKIRVQHSSPSHFNEKNYEEVPISNYSKIECYRMGSPNFSQAKNLIKSSDRKISTIPDIVQTKNGQVQYESKKFISPRQPNYVRGPLINSPKQNNQNCPRFIFMQQNHSHYSPKLLKHKSNYSLFQIPQQKRSNNYSSQLDSFIGNQINQTSLASIKAYNNTKHLRSQTIHPQIKQHFKISYKNSNHPQNNMFIYPRQRPIYSFGQNQYYQSNNIVFEKELINEVSSKNIQKTQIKRQISSLTKLEYQCDTPNASLQPEQNFLNVNQQQSNNQNKQASFINTKYKIRQYLIESIKKSQKQKIQLEKFQEQLESHLIDKNNYKDKLGAMAKQMDGRHGQIQSLSLSLLQSEFSELLNIQAQPTQQSQVQVNISMDSSLQKPNKIKKNFVQI